MAEFLPSEYDDSVFPELSQNIANNPSFKVVGFNNTNMKEDKITEPQLTKQDLLDIDKAQNEMDEWYNFDAKAEEVAKKRGLVVVYPKSTQIQVDLDTEEDYLKFLKKYENLFDNNTNDYYPIIRYQTVVSSSGLPHRHVYISFSQCLTEWQRICLQAVLGSDPKRELLNVKRMLYGVENPSRLFETPETAELINKQ